MLRVARLSDPSGHYYLEDLASELGPAWAERGAGADGPGRWVGESAAGLGLTSPVDAASLQAVLAGGRPDDGRPLVARRGGVAGYDLTFTAPKSVSVLGALARPDVQAEVVVAHEAALDAAMGYVARRAVAVRRGTGDERRLEPVDGVVGAAFTHGVSRALDPHLHTHVVVANLGHGADGRWTAIDGRGLHAHASAAGALYDAELRHRLSATLGVTWTVTKRATYELSGVDPAVTGAFSRRGAEIRGELAAVGRTTSRASRVAWASTRDPKASATPEELSAWWRARAEEAGWPNDGLGSVVGRRPSGPDRVDEHRFAARLTDPMLGSVTRRQAVRAWAGALSAGTPVHDAEQCVDQLATWGEGIGVGEGVQAPSRVVPVPHLLSSLGPRPGSPQLLEAWQDGASAISRYRARWAVTDRDRPLGVEGSGGSLAALPAQRLADHLVVSRHLDDVRRRIGRDLGRRTAPPELDLGRG